jgi:hypothetical protein
MFCFLIKSKKTLERKKKERKKKMKERIIVVVVTLCQVMYLKELRKKENMNKFFNLGGTRQREK